MSYLEEYDQSRQKSTKDKMDEIQARSYSEIVEEDIALRLGSSSKDFKRKPMSEASIEDLVESKSLEDSIKEDLEGSIASRRRSEHSRNSVTPRNYRKAMDEFNAKPTKEIIQDKSTMQKML